MSPAPITECTFCSDVEGNLDHFHRYITYNKVLKWTDDTKTALKFTDDHTMFVYGGDSQDKGIGDIRFVKLLLDLKKQYGERVQLIIGNRDENKIRLCSELAPECIDDPGVLIDTAYPYWESERNRKNTPAAFYKLNNIENSPANRLKWILKHSMGAEGAFDRRRKELAILGGCAENAIADDAVVKSYRDECDPKSPDNFMLQYLREAKIAYVFGKTIFVHGALNPRNIGTVPGTDLVEKHLPTWVDSLNAWAKQELAAFENNPYAGKTSGSRAGAGLIDYGSGAAGNGGRTVMSADFLKDDNSNHIPVAVQLYMLDNKIETVLSGHKPYGDSPNVICTGGVKAISADTSYSEMSAMSEWGEDNRGTTCVNEVIVDLEGVCTVRGKCKALVAENTTSNDSKEAEFEYTLGGAGGDKFVGRQLPDKHWIKIKMKSLPEYITCFGEGYNLHLTRKTEDELSATIFVAPETGRETLYQVKRPLLKHKGPRVMPGSDWEYTGDVVEEYWCGVNIRRGEAAIGEADAKAAYGDLTEDNIIDADKVPLAIPDAIKTGKWKFKTTTMGMYNHGLMWEWRQQGDWPKEYAERVFNMQNASDAQEHAKMHVSQLSALIGLLNISYI
jgi:hypothetical protein